MNIPGFPSGFPNDWYWSVGNRPDLVFSSSRGAYVAATDADYLQWRKTEPYVSQTSDTDEETGELTVTFAESQRSATVILCDGELVDVLAKNGLPAATVIAAGATSLGGLAPADAVAVMTAMGCSVSSTSTPALDGVYAADLATQQAITSEALYVQVTGSNGGTAKFTNGQQTRGWPDATGAIHVFTTAQFIPFAEAVAQYVDGLNTAAATLLAGGTPAWPQPATIA